MPSATLEGAARLELPAFVDGTAPRREVKRAGAAMVGVAEGAGEEGAADATSASGKPGAGGMEEQEGQKGDKEAKRGRGLLGARREP